LTLLLQRAQQINSLVLHGVSREENTFLLSIAIIYNETMPTYVGILICIHLSLLHLPENNGNVALVRLNVDRTVGTPRISFSLFYLFCKLSWHIHHSLHSVRETKNQLIHSKITKNVAVEAVDRSFEETANPCVSTVHSHSYSWI
jgi:hypothetical protein